MKKYILSMLSALALYASADITFSSLDGTYHHGENGYEVIDYTYTGLTPIKIEAIYAYCQSNLNGRCFLSISNTVTLSVSHPNYTWRIGTSINPGIIGALPDMVSPTLSITMPSYLTPNSANPIILYNFNPSESYDDMHFWDETGRYFAKCHMNTSGGLILDNQLMDFYSYSYSATNDTQITTNQLGSAIYVMNPGPTGNKLPDARFVWGYGYDGIYSNLTNYNYDESAEMPIVRRVSNLSIPDYRRIPRLYIKSYSTQTYKLFFPILSDINLGNSNVFSRYLGDSNDITPFFYPPTLTPGAQITLVLKLDKGQPQPPARTSPIFIIIKTTN